LDCIHIELTDGNVGTHEKVTIPIPTVTCTLTIQNSIFGTSVFAFPREPHGNKYPTHISTLHIKHNSRHPHRSHHSMHYNYLVQPQLG